MKCRGCNSPVINDGYGELTHFHMDGRRMITNYFCDPEDKKNIKTAF